MNVRVGPQRRLSAKELILSNWGAREARRSNQSILKEIKPEYSLEGLMQKLKLHLMRRANTFEKTLKLENLRVGEGDKRGWDG